MRILSGIDFALLPLFLLLWYGFFMAVRNQKYRNEPVLYGHFLRAWSFRVLGALLTALMYQYYYRYGDTFYYFVGAGDLQRALSTNLSAGWEIMTEEYDSWSSLTKNYLTYHITFRNDGGLFLVRIAAVLGLMFGGSYFGMSLGMTAFAFLGCWRLYRVFYDLYPHLHRPLAYAILYLPSVCFWGTGVMKDSLTIGALGVFLHGVYFLLIKRRRILSSLFWIYVGALLMIKIKIYIFLSIAPAIMLWLALMYQKRIQSAALRLMFGPFLLVAGLGGGVFALQRVSSMSDKYSFENIMEQAALTQWWISISTENSDGTGYSLGEIDPSLGGMLRLLPKAINVTLFRPYLWEARKPIVMPSALESLFALFFTLYVVFKIGLRYLLKAIFTDPVVPFCLVFALFFAFAVGFTSMNFGALARYKIPCMPFYFTALILLLDQTRHAAPSAPPKAEMDLSDA